MEVSNVVPLPIRAKLMCSECGAAGEGSCRCGAPYVSAGERAAEAIAANPKKSDRAIAEEIGVSDRTINRARKTTATNVAVEARTGKDGKTRRMPKRQPRPKKPPGVKQAQRSINCTPETWDAMMALAERHGVPTAQLLGDMVQAIVAQEELTLAPLPMTAQQKLEAAIKQHKRKLDAEHAARLREINEEVRLRVVAEGKEYFAYLEKERAEASKTQDLYREFIGNHRWVLTVDEYQSIWRCLHPDSRKSASDERLAAAFGLFEARKPQFTGKK